MMLSKDDAEYQKLMFQVKNRLGGGVPDGVIVDAIEEAYRQICEETEGWVLKTVQSVSSQNVLYSAVSNYDVNVRRVITVKLRRVGDAREFALIEPVPEDCYQLVENGIYFYSTNYLSMYHDGMIEITVAAMPNRTNVYLDSQMVEYYGNAIVYGAIAELAIQINRPWYSEQMYGFYNDRYKKECSRIMADNSSRFKRDNYDGFSG